MKTKTIEIEGKEYVIDIDKAINNGYLIPKVNPVNAEVGGVYKASGKGTINPFVVIQVVWTDSKTSKKATDPIYQLVGLGEGSRVNSGDFFEKLHTLEEIGEYLTHNRMVLDHVKRSYGHVPLKN